MAGGTCHSRVRMRCNRGKNGCFKRFTLPRHPDSYKKAVKCPHCGSEKVKNIEAERRKEQLNMDRCRCSAYPFPHQSGSMRMCENHIAVILGVEPTAEEIWDYEGVIETPRSGSC